MTQITQYRNYFEFFTYKIPFHLKKLHLHDSLEIGLVISGKGEFFIEQKTQNFKKNNIVLISPLEAHRAKSSGNNPADVFFIMIKRPFLENASLFLPDMSFYRLFQTGGKNFSNIFNDPEIKQVIENIFHKFFTQQLCSELMMIYLLELVTRLLIKPGHAAVSEKKSSQAMLDVLKYINENFREEIHIQKLAARLNISETRFRIVFRKFTGKSPYQYVISRRLKYAYLQISEKGKNTLETALDAGFDNYSSFQKLFKKEFGISPAVLKSI